MSHATISPRKLAHVVLRTRSNIDAMVQWYCVVLGAQIVFNAGGRLVFLSYDDEHHRIAIAASPDLTERPPRAAGLDHIAFTYDDIDALLTTYERLKQEGILPFVCINHGPTTSLYYNDPDHNRIELQVDNFADMSEATLLMQEQFSINPVGAEFDPEELLARLRAGAVPAELIRPTRQPSPPTRELIAKIISS
ncbi:MAG TPA: VOC family protein [Methylomirabilota bacterium]|nr:VOC family protein [Methylomirabilota bacterium]